MAGKAAVRLGLQSRVGEEEDHHWENVLSGPRKHVHLRHDANLFQVRIVCIYTACVKIVQFAVKYKLDMVTLIAATANFVNV